MAYCTRTDLEHIWTPADVLAAADDDANGTLSAGEEAHITRAIEHAAEQMNAYLARQYALADLADNAWCRDVNAVLAAYLLATRTGAAAPDGLAEQAARRLNELAQIRDGKLDVPGVVSSLADAPKATNFTVAFGKFHARILKVQTGD